MFRFWRRFHARQRLRPLVLPVMIPSVVFDTLIARVADGLVTYLALPILILG